jgi:hypothetical protein
MLLDGPPAGAETVGAQSKPPAEVDPSGDVTEGCVDGLELMGVAEPGREFLSDLVRAVKDPKPGRDECPHADVGFERLTNTVEVLGGQ